MNIQIILGLALLTAVSCILLRQYNSVYAIVAAVAGGCVLLVYALDVLGEVTKGAKELVDISGMDKQWLSLLLKALGIGYLCQFGGDLCRDAGETAMAGYVELSGKIMIVSLSLPMFQEVAGTVLRLFER